MAPFLSGISLQLAGAPQPARLTEGPYQNVPSSIRSIAGAFGFFVLIQLFTRPEL